VGSVVVLGALAALGVSPAAAERAVRLDRDQLRRVGDGVRGALPVGAIVGAPTAGANGNVNPLSLLGGFTVMWTGMRVVKHDGSQHHLIGVQPTVPATRTIRGVREGRDELLEVALDVAKGARN
jgi:hypothetical protein